MKKIWKRTLSMFLVVLLLGGAAPLGALAEIEWPVLPDGTASSWVNDGVNAVKSAAAWLGEKLHGLSLQAGAITRTGFCGVDGENITWSLDMGTGVLTISGTGAMKNYFEENHPWYNMYRYVVQTVIIKNGVTSIGNYSFYKCQNLEEIQMPASLEYIGHNAFANCKGLKSVTIPDSVKTIPLFAFYKCTGLTDIRIPNSITTIERCAFYDCESLSGISLPDGITKIEEDVFGGCINLKDIKIPASVTSIGDYAFSDSGFETFVVPDSIKSIGIGAFSGSKKLNSITIHDNVTNIGEYAFRKCTALTSISIPESISVISSCAFDFCTSLTNVYLPNTITQIGSHAFGDCTSLASFTIPNSVTGIGYSAFEGCTSLTEITLPKSVQGIGYSLFEGCTSLIRIAVEDGNDFFCNDENGVLYTKDKGSLIQYPLGSLRESFTVPGQVTSIGYTAFKGAVNLETVILLDGVTYIARYAFQNCAHMAAIELPSSLEYIENLAFDGCSCLKSVVIPEKVRTIGGAAFRNCTSLETVCFFDSTKIGSDVFENCEKIKDVYYAGTSAQWAKRDFSYGNTALKKATIHFEWSGMTEDITDDLILKSTSSPAKGATDVSFEDDLVLVFNRDVSCNVGLLSERFDYEIAVRNYNTDETIFSSENIRNTFWGQATLIENKLTIPRALLHIELGEKYYLYIGADCFSAKNDITVHFPGITDKDSYTFVCGKADQIIRKISDLEMPVIDDEREKTGSLFISFNPMWFENDSEVYVDQLADFCAQYLTLGYCYDEQTIIDDLTQIGFSDAVASMHTSREEVNHFIASGKINVEGEYYYLVFVGLIGSYREQWHSNFDPGTGSTHKGFNNAKEYIYKNSDKGKLVDYLKWLRTEKGADKEHTNILIAGHSRGAATANLVAAQLIKDQVFATADNVYTYAFATPSSTSLPERKNSEYRRIFNIINPTDFVAWVMPAAWDYGKYGTTYLLPSKTNDKYYDTYYTNMKRSFQFIKELYSDYSIWDEIRSDDYRFGEQTVDYLIYYMTIEVADLDDFYNDKLFRTPGGIGLYEHISLFDFFQNEICPFVASKLSKMETIINASDLLYLSSSLFTSNLFREIINYFVWNQGINPRFETAHDMGTYTAFMLSMDKSDLVDKTEMRSKESRFKINCPVDVDVIDKDTGEVVGRVRNNVVDEEIFAKANSVVMTVDGDSKSVWLPSNGNYDVKLIGNGTGTMDCTVSTIGAEGLETARANFFDVTVTPGLTMDCDVPENTFEPALATLTLQDGTTIQPETLTDSDLDALEIRVSTEGQGFANSLYNLTKGDYVTLTATANTNNSFLGWYENGVQISTDASYAFVAKTNRHLTAKFTNKLVQLGRVRGMTVPDLTVQYKSSRNLAPVVTADAGVKYTLTYSGFDSGIISVDKNGNVTTVKGKTGTTTVTVTATDENGNKAEAKCTVTVRYAWWQLLIRIFLFGFIWY